MNTPIVENKEECAVWGFTGTLIWGAIIGLVFVITQMVVMGLYIGIQSAGKTAAEIDSQIEQVQLSGNLLAFSTLATLIVCGLMVFGAVELKKNSCFKQYLGLAKVSLQSIKVWVLIAVAFMLITDALMLIFDMPIVPEFMSQAYTSAEPKWLFWLALIVAAPVFEELFFRGFLIPGFSASFVGPVGAVLITSALWAGIHVQYEFYLILLIFMMGIMLGIARLKTGSTLLTIGLHSLFNLVATIEAAVYLS
jgi:membrane protease YdiL (CAAX protease family)